MSSSRSKDDGLQLLSLPGNYHYFAEYANPQPMAPPRALPPPPISSRPLKGYPVSPLSAQKFLSGKVVGLLFLGTFCIFFVGVFFWKIGAVIRFFTQDRFLGERKIKTERYARTWYGWVPLARHEANKRVINRCMRKVRGWLSWRSSRLDYRWVWWDPGEQEAQKHKERETMRWFPTLISSYECPTADSIWNPGPPPEIRSSLNVEENRRPCPNPTDGEPATTTRLTRVRRTSPSESRAEDHPLKRVPSFRYRQSFTSINPYHICQQPFIVAPVIYVPPEPTSQYCSPELEVRRNTAQLHTAQSEDLPINSFGTRDWKDCGRLLRRTVSLPSMIKLTSPSVVNPVSDKKAQKSPIMKTGLVKTRPQAARLSRKYQAWASRMQIQTRNSASRFHGISGRPGSPLSEILKSISSEQSAYTTRLSGTQNSESFQGCSTDEANPPAAEIGDHGPLHEDRDGLQTMSKMRNPSHMKYESLSRPHLFTASAILAPEIPRYRPLQMRDPNCPMQHERIEEHAGRRRVTFQGIPNTEAHRAPQQSVPLRHLSNPEVRLIYNLDRRLEWLLNELDPGRKPFHFATLANHWLNTETWLVYDPPCRVSQEYRRRYGDPRCRAQFADGRNESRRPKYPPTVQRRAHTPRIDSWRLAVNKQRKTAGLQDFLREIELFDGSADEVPDGKIDPSSWILRKPPQGFPISNKQKDCFWQGASVWQEPLEEWQKVKYSYRIEKKINEARVNRTRDLRRVARGVTKIYRTTAKKLPQTPIGRRTKRDLNTGRERRQARSGNGSMGRTRTTRDSIRGDTETYIPEEIQLCRTSGHIPTIRQTSALTGEDTSLTDPIGDRDGIHTMENG